MAACTCTHVTDHQRNHTGTVALPFCSLTLKSTKPLPAQYPKELNTLGDHLRKRRLDLGLLQREVAEQIGVDESTITNWERQRTLPEIRHMPEIIQFLGYVPLFPARSFRERLVAFRTVLGLSQRRMALLFGVDPSTLAGWELGKHWPAPQS